MTDGGNPTHRYTVAIVYKNYMYKYLYDEGI